MSENKNHVDEPIILSGSVAEIQSVIDVDKYNKSMACGYDLCGSYSAFCANCDKSLNFPCAEAYLRSSEQAAEQPVPTAKRRIRIAVARKKIV